MRTAAVREAPLVVSSGMATVDRESALQSVRDVVAQIYWIDSQRPDLSNLAHR